jgi:hypothetical protein
LFADARPYDFVRGNFRFREEKMDNILLAAGVLVAIAVVALIARVRSRGDGRNAMTQASTVYLGPAESRDTSGST